MRELHAGGNLFHAPGAVVPNTSSRHSVTNTPASLAGQGATPRGRLRRGRGRSRGFTLLELMVILTITVLLVAYLIPATSKTSVKRKRISCVNNLKNVGLGLRIFAADNGDRFPWELKTNQPPAKTFDEFFANFLAITNEPSTPLIYHCPADTRKAVADWGSFSRLNMSYFLSRDAAELYPQSFLGGDRNLMTNGVRLRTGMINVAETRLSWDSDMHPFQGNVVMGDGSVQQLSIARLKGQMARAATNSLTLGIP